MKNKMLGLLSLVAVTLAASSAFAQEVPGEVSAKMWGLVAAGFGCQYFPVLSRVVDRD
jgi:hypothetical protein